MIEDDYDPLARYRDEFRPRFARLAAGKFDELARESRVDVAANRALVGKIRALQSAAGSAAARKKCHGWLMALFFLGAAGAAAGAYAVRNRPGDAAAWCVAGAIAGAVAGAAMIPLFRTASAILADLQNRISAQVSRAYGQLDTLNRLYEWDMAPRLAEKTVPGLSFDPYFTAAKLDLLANRFGWDGSFNDGKSVLFALSGEIDGNPFVFGHTLEMEWGEKTYQGTKRISWTEWEEDANGRRRRVTRSETLRACVTKPVPEYLERKFLVYGNDAAPDLSFSRRPSGLTGKDGIFEKIRKSWRLGRLKAYSRNLTDDSDFTLMSNHEFETWFHAKDRDNEVQFRLMFTPVAQMRMLALMKDSETGFGDDFVFIKAGKTNVIFPRHLDEGSIDTDPGRFRDWDFDAARAGFLRSNERYFKDVYFTLAPLLAIPLYRQTTMDDETRKRVDDPQEASFWEREAIANHLGEEVFAHRDSVTRNILKTKLVRRENGESAVNVTACGFRAENRVDYVSVRGGDGKWHDVAVPWVEYLPVERTVRMHVAEGESPGDSLLRRARGSRVKAWRRSILAFVRD